MQPKQKGCIFFCKVNKNSDKYWQSGTNDDKILMIFYETKNEGTRAVKGAKKAWNVCEKRRERYW